MQDERGATAVMVAIFAVVLFMAGAVAVDMGQAYAKRSALQSNVDMAVMAAAAELTKASGCNTEVVTKAEEFLVKAANEVHGQVTMDLDDGDPIDGEISCPGNWRVNLIAPRAIVELTMGKAFESGDSLDVPANASAQIKSPSRNHGLPMYGVTGCDYGPQIIRDDSGPAPTPAVPPLTPDSAAHNTATFTISPDIQSTPSAATQVTLTGSNLTGATAVTFTGAGGPPDHHEVPATSFVSATSTTIVVNVPAAVLDIEDVWFVRVLKGSDYSERASAQRFTVGAPRAYCAGSLEGNYGTIDLPRTDTSFDLEWNIIFGPQPSLAIHPAPSGECSGDTGSVESKTAPVNGTNCIASEPGVKIAQTNDGLISGKGGKAGRLDKDSTSGCSRTGDNSRTPTTIKSKNINDDLLSCFIINNARISDLINATAGSVGEKALSADIFNSPRYFWIPIVQREPATGKKSWPIVAFRPGFITDQAVSATEQSPGTVSEHNGLVAAPSGLRELHVILFDERALPEFAPSSGGEIDYIGSGTKVIVLVD
ncbi:TadE/TadG family type IV pilus assembly protein [Nocardioides astragali]|nr:Tad domain-containing protein [Nocardioides astragali]